MNYDNDQDELIDLGTVSVETKGTGTGIVDQLGGIPLTGLSDD